MLEAISHLNALGADQTAQRRRAIIYLILLILNRRPAKEQKELLVLVDEHTDMMEVETMAQSIIELSERGSPNYYCIWGKITTIRSRINSYWMKLVRLGLQIYENYRNWGFGAFRTGFTTRRVGTQHRQT